MDSAPKRQKPHGQPQQQIQDRISSLLDDILCHILSFLPTKHAVATAVLSTRWKYLFISLTHLDFDDSLHRTFANFVRFVYRVLLHRNVSHVIKFRLNCNSDHVSDDINSWISNAIWHKVEELDIYVNMRNSNMIPPSLFSCGTLVDLKLCCVFFFVVPSDVFLPNLKNLYLQSVEFEDDDTLKSLFSGCPVLVNLVIHYCKMDNIRVLDISVPTLERLTINKHSHGPEVSDYEVVFDVPKLEYLKYKGSLAECYSIKSLGYVVAAEILLNFNGKQLGQYLGRTGGSMTYSKLIYDLITKISNVRFLHLSGPIIHALNLFWQPARYPNLTHLEFGDSIISRRLPDFLESSPNLEQLVIYKGFIDRNRSRLHVPETVPLCLSLHIKGIVIKQFLGKKDELDMVEYFLKSAKVLKKMTISSDLPLEEKWCLSQKLLKFPRCSEACQIVLT